MTSSLEQLPIDIFPLVCHNLEISDILNFSQVNNAFEKICKKMAYSDFRKIKISSHKDDSKVDFIRSESSGKTTSILLEKTDDWQNAIFECRKTRDIELDLAKDASTSQIFHLLRKSQMRLRSLKVNIRDGEKNDEKKASRLYNNCIVLVSQHRSTLEKLEVSTSDGQWVSARLTKDQKLHLEYCQPKDSEKMQNHSLAYNMFHALFERRCSTNVTLEIESNSDANVALQRAFQIAIPHTNRKFLEILTIELGNSLQKMSEEDMKSVILRHVDEFHYTTPNLHHFTCNLPHTSINLSLECLNNEIREQIEKSRKSLTPYNPSICLRSVRCK